MNDIKFKIYRNERWLFISVTMVFMLSLTQLNSDSSIKTLIGLFTLLFIYQKQKIEDVKIFREIFKECNSKYDSMNEKIDIISKKQSEKICAEDKNYIIDYLNLCGEEYLYYKTGFIFPEVWLAWHSGMKSILEKSPEIRAIWEEEKKSNSYYGLPL